MEPVAGAWAESKDGSIKANTERTAASRMRLVSFADTPGESLYWSFELTKVLTVIDLAGLQTELVCSPLFDHSPAAGGACIPTKNVGTYATPERRIS
jgi:hypothetical protein